MLTYAGRAKHPATAEKRFTAARIVCRRAGWMEDIYADPAVEDARAIALRRRPPPKKAVAAHWAVLRRFTRRLPADRRHSLRLIYCALARPSDWMGSTERIRVPLRDVRIVHREVHALYRRTKPDVAGVGRRVAFYVPASTRRWLRDRKRSRPPNTPVIECTYDELRRALRPAGLQLRSLRRGAVRAALLAGARITAVMALTGHADPRTVFRYAGVIAPQIRRGGLRASAAAQAATVEW